MKINTRNPLHWLYLLMFGANVVAAILLRPLLHRRGSGRVLLYGHKRNGNLLAIHEWVMERRPEGLHMSYLTMDPLYYRELRRQGVPCVLAIGPAAIIWLATADVTVSDHGLHAMSFMVGRTDMKFFDVWHGIPFKGFDEDDFRLQQRFDEVWVPSPLLATMYAEKFGFNPARIKVTGYARTDRLLADTRTSKVTNRHRLGVDNYASMVLFAPTWTQDSQDRSIFPFGVDARTFCSALSKLAARHNAIVAFRAHLNSAPDLSVVAEFPNITLLPAARYPDTESILLVSDILVCDWSSIAFDFLLLSRPTIFLDVEPPFAKGFSLDRRFRFGAISSDMDSMLNFVDRYLADAGDFHKEFGESTTEIRHEVYGGFDDGMSANRCVDRLKMAVATAKYPP